MSPRAPAASRDRHAPRDRIRDASPDGADARIRRDTLERLARAGAQPATIPAELDRNAREWDVERALMANAATLALSGALLALTADRRFALVPAVVGGFLLQHAVQGWCPPLPVLRALGFRSPQEIAAERTALRLLAGELAPPDPASRPRDRAARALQMAEGTAP
ncbi:DUF2892 domain-containing protein [Rhodobacteraceae bacterium HSP-20]|uniref:DUF2892 domain-containing protein n=1 Tax=Paragemmobacter amnigenus TaxID=2852097 RepID=A0ABS6J8M9_9RHOB|nr:YgaP-like transmembrane domain [Rhodobacter amnigenus]MBU9698715.1 DUF2892 domain-containing protein [Rhodobacter amnigenus]MBV4389942.1 DUF2892 domain-containing protein [Rhodobacter amnigenus]